MGTRAGKYKLGARAGKYKFGARAGKYKFGARAGAGGQAKGREIQIPLKEQLLPVVVEKYKIIIF